jgi:hypothetical protein
VKCLAPSHGRGQYSEPKHTTIPHRNGAGRIAPAHRTLWATSTAPKASRIAETMLKKLESEIITIKQHFSI